ncbi:hypothetical protein [Shewanella sp.]|uniref:hypothetical protein n=1 Tax=Shewanella sp. TaxID=50422 RepID=UPI003F3CFC5F
MGGRIEITKEHVGSVVFGYPTGNNVRRSVDFQSIAAFEVVGFGRKYAKVRSLRGGNCELSIDPLTGASQSEINSGHGSNAGYMFFDSELDALYFVRRSKLNRAIAIRLSSTSSVSELSDDLIDAIVEQLGISVD